MKQRLTTIAAVGVLGLGGVASTFVLAPAVVSAAASNTTTSGALADRVDRIRDALGGLVDDGALTDSQADKVAETLAERLRGHHGVDKRELIDDLAAKASERVHQAVEDGRFSEAQGERLKARLRERLAAMVDGDFPGPNGGVHSRGPQTGWQMPDHRPGNPRHDHPRPDGPPAPGTAHTEI